MLKKDNNNEQLVYYQVRLSRQLYSDCTDQSYRLGLALMRILCMPYRLHTQSQWRWTQCLLGIFLVM